MRSSQPSFPRQILTGSKDGSARIWLRDPSEPKGTFRESDTANTMPNTAAMCKSAQWMAQVSDGSMDIGSNASRQLGNTVATATVESWWYKICRRSPPQNPQSFWLERV